MLNVIESINGVLGSAVPLFLLLSGCTLTFIMFPRFCLHPLAFFPRRRKKSEEKLNNERNAHSPFGSFCLALAGTLGVGNISGVAAALASGGEGAIFWLWICSVFCAVLKYAETLLAVRFRTRSPDGTLSGGAHSYISRGLGMHRLALFFCVLCVISSFTTGNITQAKAASESVKLALGIPELICGILLFLLLIAFCRSGSSVYSFTLKLIPLLCGAYILLCAAAIFKLRSGIPAVTAGILSSAFTPRAGLGGIIGVACSKAVRFGITRGVMSNEAGCGTAPIAHASAEVSSPVSQAFLGIIEVLFDTLLLCTLTAYVILLADVPLDGELSTVTAISAFTSVLGDRFAAPLAIAVFLFALASAAGWSYYGSACLSALGASPKALRIYNISYALCALIGAVIPEGLIWQLSDLSIYFMAFINTAAVMLLSPIVVEETKSFLKNAKLLRIKQKSP